MELTREEYQDTITNQPEDCDSCQFTTTELRLFDYGTDLTTNRLWAMWLCPLCSGTFAGNALQYPEQYPQAGVLKAICYVGNAILAELRKTP